MPKQSRHYLGVEWVGEQLRAAVFDEHWRLKGRASRSAKTNRGFGEVLKRTALCALDAVDEADLQPEAIAATALLSDGTLAGQTWGPQEVNQLAGHLPARLSSKLLTAGRASTILWAVHEYELGRRPMSWVGLFAEPEPTVHAANRLEPGRVRRLTFSVGPTAQPIATSKELIDTLMREQVAAVVLIGDEYEDLNTGGAKQLQESLAVAGSEIKLHVPLHGTHVGTWAAARLAARTFVG